MLTVKKLRELIKDLPDDTPILGDGHFGEGVKIFSDPHIRYDIRVVDYGWSRDDKEIAKVALVWPNADIGPDPY